MSLNLDFTTRPVILVVDDTPDNLTLMAELLQDRYAIKVANNGERALRVAAGTPPPDLILLDIMMPEMDGYETLAELRANPATRHIPVIFVTALDADEDEERGLALGAVDYIAKPIRPAILLGRIRTQLDLKLAQDQLRRQNASLEAEVQRRVAENLAIQEQGQRNEARLNRMRQLILSSASEGIFGVDVEGRINFRGFGFFGGRSLIYPLVGQVSISASKVDRSVPRFTSRTTWRVTYSGSA